MVVFGLDYVRDAITEREATVCRHCQDQAESRWRGRVASQG